MIGPIYFSERVQGATAIVKSMLTIPRVGDFVMFECPEQERVVEMRVEKIVYRLPSEHIDQPGIHITGAQFL